MELKLFWAAGGRRVSILSLFPLEINFGGLAGWNIAASGHCLELMTYGTHELDLRERCAGGTRLSCG